MIRNVEKGTRNFEARRGSIGGAKLKLYFCRFFVDAFLPYTSFYADANVSSVQSVKATNR